MLTNGILVNAFANDLQSANFLVKLCKKLYTLWICTHYVGKYKTIGVLGDPELSYVQLIQIYYINGRDEGEAEGASGIPGGS